MYTNSNRHRMNSQFKEGDYVRFKSDYGLIGSGLILEVLNTQLLVEVGNGGVGLRYVDKAQVIETHGR